MLNVEIDSYDVYGAIRPIKLGPDGRIGQSYYFRDVVSTGTASLTNAQESTILAAIANVYLDLVQVRGTNTSTNAIKVDLRSGTGGSVQDSVVIPAGQSVAIPYPMTLPASEKNVPWTAKVNSAGEVSDSPVTISMTASNNA